MALDDRGMQNGGARSGTGMRQLLKKGPWTAIEDTILKEYVKKHGEGNWNAVQKNSGLMRCGKSCRLRWANHLRPNLKKGAFSPEEERIIIDLHARFGNKWARMAAQLPGRTDNEIKNYWNTRLKRRQRAGLPIYPQELQSQNQQETNQPQSLTSSPFDPQKATYNNPPSLPLLAMFNPSTMKFPIMDQFPLNSNNIFRDPPNGLPLPPPPSMKNSHFSSSSTYVPNNNFGYGMSDSRPMPMPPFQQQHYPNFSQTMRPFMGIPPNQNELISRIGINSINYPSGQSSMPITTASSSENTGSDFGSSDANNYTDVVGLSQGNSGFLEDLLEESQTLTQDVQIEVNNFLDLKKDNDKQKGKSLWEEYELFVEEKVGDHQDEAILTEESVYSFGHGADVNLNNNSENSSPDPNVSPGIFWKNEGSFQEIIQADEDIMCLLDNFPLAATVPSWDDEKDDQKINSKIAIDDHHKAENQGEDSFKSQVAIATTSGTKKHDWELGGCCWNNMPSFC